jgi:negative regulator of sigma E activity
MKNCEEYAALLDAYVDGELSPDEMARVQAHLDDCPGCRAYVDDALAIRAAFPEVEDTEVPDGFADRVMAAIQEEPAPKQKKKTPWVKVLAPLAACCAIVILLQSGVFQSYSSSDTAAATTTSSSASESTSVAGDEDVTTDTTAAEPETRESFSLDSADADTAESADTAASSADQAAKDTYATAVESLDDGTDEDGWVEYGNVVFSGVVFLTSDYVGDALDGYEGKPYSNANYPEDGVVGVGYALEQADFERILNELGYPLGPMMDQNRTTDLSCIVVMDDSN